jgi:hypothetical protein
MYCNRCGAANPDSSRFCTQCGASFVAAGAPSAVASAPAGTGGLTAGAPPGVAPYPPVARLSSRLPMLAALWLVYAILRAGGGLMMMGVGAAWMGGWNHAVWSPGWQPMWFGPGFLAAIFHWLAFVSLAMALVAALTAWALYTRQPWGRVLAIVMAILALFHPILGTALGIYTLIVLVPSEAGPEYRHLSGGTA